MNQRVLIAAHPQRPSPLAAPAPLRTGLLSAGMAAVETALIAIVVMLARGADASPVAITVTLSSTAILAALFLTIGMARHDYAVDSLLLRRGHGARALRAWMLAFGGALIVATVTRNGALCSLDSTGVVALGGALVLPLGRIALARQLHPLATAGRLVARRTMLIGLEHEIDAFMVRHAAAPGGRQVVGAAVLRADHATIGDDLALAVAIARIQAPTDVLMLLPRSNQTLITRCVEALRQLPAAIHLGSSDFLDLYRGMRIEQVGATISVEIVRRPLSPADLRIKRAFDIAMASTALLVLSPLLLLAAVAIKLDSRGPVLFRQRRYGFNQQPFRIFKFRTMTTMEDSAALRQVTAGDDRVTRVGRVLRRTSLDELPQLVNVLHGEMSLVGPRPHALAHDQQFERIVAAYARRYNVRPGITGWAQVRGFRGETDTPEKIKGRIALDLAYVDNWSLWFDIAILLRTILSPSTFRNAR